MTPFCQIDIEAEEGFEAYAYPDPLSPLAAACMASHLTIEQYRQIPGWRSVAGSPWTDGYGETGATINADSTIDQADAAAFVSGRIASLIQHLTMVLTWFPPLDDVRQDVLLSMAYELGVSGLLAFKETLAYVAADEYAQAAAAMLQSKWALQVPARAKRLSLQMQTGVRA